MLMRDRDEELVVFSRLSWELSYSHRRTTEN